MADITWNDVLLVAADLTAGVAAGFQQLIVDWVNETLVATEFQGNDSITYKLARCYLAAHYAYLSKEAQDGRTGQVASESEGGVSVSWVQPSGTPGASDDFSRTVYGRTFASFVRRSPANVGFVA